MQIFNVKSATYLMLLICIYASLAGHIYSLVFWWWQFLSSFSSPNLHREFAVSSILHFYLLSLITSIVYNSITIVCFLPASKWFYFCNILSEDDTEWIVNIICLLISRLRITFQHTRACLRVEKSPSFAFIRSSCHDLSHI